MSQTATPRRQRSWDLRAAGNFIGGGTGSGLIVLAAIAAVAGAPFRLPLALGLGCVAAGLSLVWLEIGKPWRAFNVFFHPRTSWMTREGIVATMLIPLGAIALAADSVPAAALAALLAGGFLFCQARILRAARGIPAWRQAQIVPLILATGLAEGCGVFLLAGTQAVPWLALTLLALLAREAAWLAYRSGLAGTPAAARALAVFATPPARLARAGQLAALAALALALGFALLEAPGTPALPATLLAWTGGVLAALSGWGVKALLITRAAFIRAVVLPVVPTRGSGGRGSGGSGGSHARPV